VAPECRLVVRAGIHSRIAMRIDLAPFQRPCLLRGCN
jgi:hypothetical protein